MCSFYYYENEIWEDLFMSFWKVNLFKKAKHTMKRVGISESEDKTARINKLQNFAYLEEITEGYSEWYTTCKKPEGNDPLFEILNMIVKGEEIYPTKRLAYINGFTQDDCLITMRLTSEQYRVIDEGVAELTVDRDKIKTLIDVTPLAEYNFKGDLKYKCVVCGKSPKLSRTIYKRYKHSKTDEPFYYWFKENEVVLNQSTGQFICPECMEELKKEDLKWRWL